MHSNNCNWFNELKNAHNNEASPRTKDAISRHLLAPIPLLPLPLLHPLWRATAFAVIKCNFIAKIKRARAAHSKWPTMATRWAIKRAEPPRHRIEPSPSVEMWRC